MCSQEYPFGTDRGLSEVAICLSDNSRPLYLQLQLVASGAIRTRPDSTLLAPGGETHRLHMGLWLVFPVLILPTLGVTSAEMALFKAGSS